MTLWSTAGEIPARVPLAQRKDRHLFPELFVGEREGAVRGSVGLPRTRSTAYGHALIRAGKLLS